MTRNRVIQLPWTRPPVSNNQRPGNWAQGSRARATAKDEARWAIRAQKVAAMDEPVEVCIHWRIPDNRLRDADNLGLTLKVSLDAAVAEGILPADDWTVVRRTAQEIHPPIRGVAASMWLEIKEIDE